MCIGKHKIFSFIPINRIKKSIMVFERINHLKASYVSGQLLIVSTKLIPQQSIFLPNSWNQTVSILFLYNTITIKSSIIPTHICIDRDSHTPFLAIKNI